MDTSFAAGIFFGPGTEICCVNCCDAGACAAAVGVVAGDTLFGAFTCPASVAVSCFDVITWCDADTRVCAVTYPGPVTGI